MALVLFIVKPSSAQGGGGSVGRMGGREAKVFDPFCLGPLHAPTPGRVQQRLSAALPHARAHTQERLAAWVGVWNIGIGEPSLQWF